MLFLSRLFISIPSKVTRIMVLLTSCSFAELLQQYRAVQLNIINIMNKVPGPLKFNILLENYCDW